MFKSVENTKNNHRWIAPLTLAICAGILFDATGILALIGIGVVIGLVIGIVVMVFIS
jgi:uncharacterized membrane protein (Fun14 family)